MRICEKCGVKIKPREPDPCIGKYLEGIAHACCGHGEDARAYCCGFDNCKPNQSVTGNAPFKIPKPHWKLNKDKNEWEWIIDEKYWEQDERGTWIAKWKPSGYWIKRGKEALEYMENIK